MTTAPFIHEGEKIVRQDAIKRLTDMQYDRNDVDFQRGVIVAPEFKTLD